MERRSSLSPASRSPASGTRMERRSSLNPASSSPASGTRISPASGSSASGNRMERRSSLSPATSSPASGTRMEKRSSLNPASSSPASGSRISPASRSLASGSRMERRSSLSTTSSSRASGTRMGRSNLSPASSSRASGTRMERRSNLSPASSSPASGTRISLGSRSPASATRMERRSSLSPAISSPASGTRRERGSRLSPGSSSPASRNDYEIFLSFRGRDTRQSFTDCLYECMKDAGIRVFRDNDELHIGKRIGGALLKALDNSRIYIPIFSKTYASSKWCLMELAKMLENTSKSEGKKEVLPIFFDVKPDDVKLKTPMYRDVLREHKKKYSTDEVKAWQEALVEVGKIKGWTLKTQGHGKLIKLVIKEVLMKLNIKCKKLTEHFIEDHSQINAILELLDIKSEGVRFVGLHGMGGIGKTTMAKVIFNKLHSQFDHCCFLENVREISSRFKGIECLQKQLLSIILGSQSVHEIYDPDEGINMIKERLCSKKVLIVLDDVDEEEQLGKLAGKCDWFGSGSRIIITTREKGILNSEVGKSYGQVIPHSRGILPYEFHEMKLNKALQLFCKHAFRRDSPLEGYDNLSKQMVSTLGKLPLAIEVIGSYLSDSCMNQELWEETLKKIQKIPPKEVQDTLMISYDKLDFRQRQVFLDIACLFIGRDKTYPIYMWRDCDYFPIDAIRVLLCKSLIKIREDNRFWMHDQVRDLGRHIVYEKICTYPGKYSRVWTDEDASNILKSKEGNEGVEALSLSFVPHREDYCSITHEDMASLKNLRFLWMNQINFVGDFQNLLLKLRWLSLQHCPLNFTAENFCPINLVVLELFNSDITGDWDGWSKIKARKLKVLELTFCPGLSRTPNFSNFMSLEILILAGCQWLTTIDRSIGELKQLKTLNMEGCRSLQELPEEIGSLKSLSKIIWPNYCPELLKLPETIGNLKALSRLMLNGSKINRLPDSIGGLVNLTILSLNGCREIKELPERIGELTSLVKLVLSWSGIVDLPDSIGNLKRLKTLRMIGTPIRKFPKAIIMLEMLEVLKAPYWKDMAGEIPEEIGSLCRLRELRLPVACNSKWLSTISRLSCLEKLELVAYDELQQLPEEIGSLSQLRELMLSGTHISKVPSTISRLSCLETLNLRGCRKLQQLPKLPSSLRHLKLPLSFNLRRCRKLQQLPKLPSSVRHLKLPLSLGARTSRHKRVAETCTVYGGVWVDPLLLRISDPGIFHISSAHAV